MNAKTAATPVKFTKGHKDYEQPAYTKGEPKTRQPALPFGSTYRVSACGRFWAIRSEYSLPTASVSWTLYDTKTGEHHKGVGFDGCREWAGEILADEQAKASQAARERNEREATAAAAAIAAGARPSSVPGAPPVFPPKFVGERPAPRNLAGHVVGPMGAAVLTAHARAAADTRPETALDPRRTGVIHIDPRMGQAPPPAVDVVMESREGPDGEVLIDSYEVPTVRVGGSCAGQGEDVPIDAFARDVLARPHNPNDEAAHLARGLLGLLEAIPNGTTLRGRAVFVRDGRIHKLCETCHERPAQAKRDTCDTCYAEAMR